MKKITDGNRKAIEDVRRLHERAVSGDMPTDVAMSAAWSAAWSARLAAWRKIAAKSIEIFAHAPVVDGPAIETSVRDELCCRRLWCADGKVLAAHNLTGGM